MDWSQLLPILGIGSILGGIAGAYFQSRFQHKKQLKEWEHEAKKKRYIVINLLLLARIDFAKNADDFQRHRPHIKTMEDLDREIETEFYNSFLFASEDVINTLTQFIKAPSYIIYCSVVFEMRKDLWGYKKDPRFTWDSILYINKTEHSKRVT